MTTDTYEMGVENISFMLEKWNSDLHPLGSYRELAMNSIEAILRTPEGTGTVEFGIYEPHYQLTGTPKLCCIDTGDGMSAAKLEKYINNLGASINQQEFDKNYGGGLKIGVVPANPEGVTFLSWEKDKPGNQVTVWKDPETGVFGLKKIKLMDGSYGYSAPVDAAFKPGLIKASGSGTVVILHGTSETENTMGVPAKIQRSKRSVKNWLPRYLNERFYVIPDGVELTVRQNPKIDTESRDSFGIQITGQKAFLTANSEEHGIEDLPLAKYHWYVLKDSKTLSSNVSE